MVFGGPGLALPVNVRPVIVPATYAAGDAIGVAVRVPNASRGNKLITRLANVIVTDKADQNAALRLVFYNQAPSAQTDNAAYSPSDADLEKIVGLLDLAAGTDLGGGDIAPITFNSTKGFEFCTISGNSLWVQFVVGAASTPVYASATDLLAKFLFAQ